MINSLDALSDGAQANALHNTTNGHATPNAAQIAASIIQRGHAVPIFAGLVLTNKTGADVWQNADHDTQQALLSAEFAKKHPAENLIFQIVAEHFHLHTDIPDETTIRAIVTARANTGNAQASTCLKELANLAGYLPVQLTNGNAAHIAQLLLNSIRTAPEKLNRFSFISLAELMGRPDPDFLVHRLLTIGGTSLLTAKHASFKSFFALDIGLCVATKRPWHGYEVRRGAVVYIAAEGASGLKKRAAAWLAHHGEDMPSNFIILDIPFQVADAAARRAFIEEIAEIGPVLIVLDTLARCAVGLDENNAGDMGNFADAVGTLAKESGAHVLTVHHNNKSGEYRGSSAVPAAVDTHLSMERRDDVVTLKTEKQKDSEELPELLFGKIEVSIPNTGGKGHSLVFEIQESFSGSRFRLSQVEQKVFNELKDAFGQPGATAAQWCEVCKGAGISDRNFYRARKRLIEMQAVLCPNEGERGAKFTPSFDYCQSLPIAANGSEAVRP